MPSISQLLFPFSAPISDGGTAANPPKREQPPFLGGRARLPGRHEDHWREAEKEIAAENQYRPARKKPTVEAKEGEVQPEAHSTTAESAKSQRPWDAATSKEVSENTDARKREARRSLLVPLPPRRAVLPRKAKPSRAAVHLGALPSQAGKRESPGRSRRPDGVFQALRSCASPRLTPSKNARQAGQDDQDADRQHQRSRRDTSHQVSAKRCREHATDNEADR